MAYTMLTIDLTSWGDRWALAGISVLMVFVILIILVFLLQVFSAVAKKSVGKPLAATPLAEATETEKAAVATALWLHFHSQHDIESGILTINTDYQSHWHN